MSSIRSKQAAQAAAYAQRTGCSTAVAARRYGVSVRTVQRWLADAGLSRKLGRPTNA
jgi:transposase